MSACPGRDPLGASFVHASVEATKLAFGVRGELITDPDYMSVDPAAMLAPGALEAMGEARALRRAEALA